MNAMYRKMILYVVIAILLSVNTSHANTGMMAEQQNTAYDSAASVNNKALTENEDIHRIDVPGRGNVYYYAQNDPIWKERIYSHRRLGHRKTFGEGGCVPTAFSIVLRNLVPLHDLPAMNRLTNRGYFITDTSLSPSLITSKAKRIYLTSQEDYQLYLPLIIGAYAAGNNPSNHLYIKEKGGTNHDFYRTLSAFFGLSLRSTPNLEVALKALDTDGFVITSSGGKFSPFTPSGHFFVLVSYDKEYVYFLDPYLRTTYEYDKKGILEVVGTGLSRFKLQDVKKVALNRFFVFHSK